MKDLHKIPRSGWSSEERCKDLIEQINHVLKPKKPWTASELCIMPFEYDRWELVLLMALWSVDGCSGGYVREQARIATSTRDTLALQRLFEHVKHHLEVNTD